MDLDYNVALLAIVIYKRVKLSIKLDVIVTNLSILNKKLEFSSFVLTNRNHVLPKHRPLVVLLRLQNTLFVKDLPHAVREDEIPRRAKTLVVVRALRVADLLAHLDRRTRRGGIHTDLGVCAEVLRLPVRPLAAPRDFDARYHVQVVSGLENLSRDGRNAGFNVRRRWLDGI